MLLSRITYRNALKSSLKTYPHVGANRLWSKNTIIPCYLGVNLRVSIAKKTIQ